MSATLCPFSRLTISSAERPVTDEKRRKDGGGADQDGQECHQLCPREEQEKNEADLDVKAGDGVDQVAGAKCPFGYDSLSFKIGPFSCVICRALLFDTCRTVPCGHIFCRGCISQFQDCPVCGADIKDSEADAKVQELVDRFIEGHARIKRPTMSPRGDVKVQTQKDEVTYEDVSLARGSFLLQHALRAFQARNLESAKSRLSLCLEDTTEELERDKSNPVVCLQLGAVLGMLGDCCRALGDTGTAITHYEKSVELLEDVPDKDSETVHALSVSLNKLGDLRYYAQDLGAARGFYKRALDVRKKSLKESNVLSTQVLDIAVSLAKVADVDRAMGNETAAIQGFQEGVKILEGLSFGTASEDKVLQERWCSIVDFLHSQLPAHRHKQ